MAGKLYRHGDVLIQEVTQLPADATLDEGVTLAYGEVTGHAHRIENPEAAELLRGSGRRFVRILAPTRIVHEEHKPIPLNPGVYEFWLQREYDPELQSRWVMD